MNKLTPLFLIAAVLAVTYGDAAAASEQDDVAMAKKLSKTYHKAVVHVLGVVKVSAEGEMSSSFPTQEQKSTTLGTVIDPSGMTVTSYMSLNPAEALGTISFRGRKLRLKGELSDVKLRYADGTEVPARVVMKDEDLDLAFIVPTEKLDAKTKAKFAAVDLADAAAKAAVLDRVITLGRAGKSLTYTAIVGMGRVRGIVTKPRTVYLAPCSPGQPAFTGSGKLLGIGVVRKGPRRSGRPDVTPVVLPAADVQEIAEQAKEETAKPASAPA